MKTLFRNLFFAVLTLTIFTGFANTVKPAKFENLVITLENVKPGQKLYIKDDQGNTLYKEVIKETGDLRKNFNLESLEDGNYKLEIEKDFEIEVIPVSVIAKKATLLRSESYLYFKPVVRQDDNILYISKMNFEDSPIKLQVLYDAKYGLNDFKLIYSEIIKNEGSLERIYKLDKNEKGIYKVIVTSDGRNYTNQIKI